MSLSDDTPRQKPNPPMTADTVDSDVPNRFTVLGPLKMMANPIAQLINTFMDLIGLISVALTASKLLFEKNAVVFLWRCFTDRSTTLAFAHSTLTALSEF